LPDVRFAPKSSHTRQSVFIDSFVGHFPGLWIVNQNEVLGCPRPVPALVSKNIVQLGQHECLDAARLMPKL
jgi:hypothetical protein